MCEPVNNGIAYKYIQTIAMNIDRLHVGYFLFIQDYHFNIVLAKCCTVLAIDASRNFEVKVIPFIG